MGFNNAYAEDAGDKMWQAALQCIGYINKDAVDSSVKVVLAP